MDYVTVESFREYRDHREVLCRSRMSLIESHMDARMGVIEEKINSSNTLMKFTAAMVSAAVIVFGFAVKLGWI